MRFAVTSHPAEGLDGAECGLGHYRAICGSLQSFGNFSGPCVNIVPVAEVACWKERVILVRRHVEDEPVQKAQLGGQQSSEEHAMVAGMNCLLKLRDLLGYRDGANIAALVVNGFRTQGAAAK